MSNNVLDPMPYRQPDGTRSADSSAGDFLPRDGAIVEIPALRFLLNSHPGNDEVGRFAHAILTATLRHDGYRNTTPANPATVGTAIRLGEVLIQENVPLPDVAQDGGTLVLSYPNRPLDITVDGSDIRLSGEEAGKAAGLGISLSTAFTVLHAAIEREQGK